MVLTYFYFKAIGKRFMSSRGHFSSRDYPLNVGILAMDVYFPKTYVAQEDLGNSIACIEF